jgi:hypothetical protein
VGRSYKTFNRDDEYHDTKVARANDKSFRKTRHEKREIVEPVIEDYEPTPRANSMFKNYRK